MKKLSVLTCLSILISFAVCVVSCDGVENSQEEAQEGLQGDSQGDEGQEGDSQESVKLLQSYEINGIVYRLAYDSSLRLVECAEWDGDRRTFGVTVLYNDEAGTVEIDSERESNDVVTFSDGRPVKIGNVALAYNENGELSSWTSTNSSGYTRSCSYEWSEGNIVNATYVEGNTSYSYEYTYTEYENKFNFDFWARRCLNITEYYSYFTGPITKNLVASCKGMSSTATYSYEFDNAGYVTKATETYPNDDDFVIDFSYEKN